MDILRDFFLKKNLDTTFMSVEYKNSGALYLSRVSPSSRRSAFQCFASARLPLPFCEVLWPFTSLRRAWRLLRRLDSTVGRPTSAKDGDRACYCAPLHCSPTSSNQHSMFVCDSNFKQKHLPAGSAMFSALQYQSNETEWLLVQLKAALCAVIQSFKLLLLSLYASERKHRVSPQGDSDERLIMQ